MRVIEGPERRRVLALKRSSDASAQPEPLDALAYDLFEPAVSDRAPGAAFLANEVDQQRSHLVALVALMDDRDPDAQIEALELALRAGDGHGEIVGCPGLEQAVWDLAWTGVGQDLRQRDDARLPDVRGVVAVEVALNLVEGICCEQLDEIRRDVTQDCLPGPERARRTPRAAANLLFREGMRQPQPQAASSSWRGMRREAAGSP